MLTATQSFLDSLEKWTTAIRGNDLGAARMHAEHLRYDGALLIIHPDFYHCFEQRCPGLDPKEVLTTIGQFLMCATDCRSRAMKSR